MNKYIFCLLFYVLLIPGIANGQLQLRTKLDKKLTIFQLEDGSYKFHEYDQLKKMLLIYNLDCKLWRGIKINLPKGHYLGTILNISQYLFNNDDQLELMYTSIKPSPFDNYEDPLQEIPPTQKTFNLIQETGVDLLKVVDSNRAEVIISGNDKRLIVYRKSDPLLQYDDQTLIYSF